MLLIACLHHLPRPLLRVRVEQTESPAPRTYGILDMN